MNEVYASTSASSRRRARRSRSRSCPSGALVEIEAIAPDLAVDRTIEERWGGLGLDAYVVGGAVRDEQLGLDAKDADFVVPGVGYAACGPRSIPHGRVEDLEVAGQPSGRAALSRGTGGMGAGTGGDRVRAAAAPSAATGPGRHEFEIVAEADISVEDDMRPA